MFHCLLIFALTLYAMVNTCCAPNCKGNYKTGPKVSLFRFPKDEELKQKWLDFLKREKEFVPTDTHRVSVLLLNISRSDCLLFFFNYHNTHFQVCELHFKPEEIIREEVIVDPKKNILYKSKLHVPKFADGAYFWGSYL